MKLIIFSLLIFSLLIFSSNCLNYPFKKNNLKLFNMEKNTLLNNNGLPSFKSFSASEVEPGIDYIIDKLETDFTNLEKDIEKTDNINLLYKLAIDNLTLIEYPLSYGWGLVSHLHSVKNNDDLRNVYEKMQPKIIQITTKISQSKILYNALLKLKNSNKLNKVQQRIVDASCHGMFLSGIGLEDKEKEEFNNKKIRLAELSTKFSNNVLDAIKGFELYITDDENMKNLPSSALELYSSQAKEKYPKSTPEDGPWKITLDIPSYLPIMLHHPSSELREKLYRVYISKASSGENNNLPLIEEILKLKKEKANILKFKNHAELSLSSKMASSVEEIENLLNMLADKAKPFALKDNNKIKEYANEISGECIDLNLWDIPYWSERLKEKELQFKEEELKPYLPLNQVLDGLFNIAKDLFNIKIVERDNVKEKIDVWNEDVKFFDIYDISTDQHIASFYLDPYSRPGEKKGGAWMNGCLDKSKYLNKKPVAYLICNGSPPIKKDDGSVKPSLMTFREVETLFHEFGHGLQHMLTEVDDADAAGINNIEWDAVELPSQFMENWCYHYPTVMTFAKHYQTGKPLPKEFFDKIVKQKTFMTANGMLRQVYFSMLDLYLHDKRGDKEDVIEIQKNIASKYLINPILDDDRFVCSFSHIFAGGYSAGYYSYKWAEIMSSDAFGAFEELNLDNKEEIAKLGKKFRETILAKGGGEHPAEVFRQFRGRDTNPDALLRHNGLV